MFEKFTELSKKLIIQSEEIALSMGSDLDTHHILISLTTFPGTLAFEVLKSYQIDQEQLKLVLSLQEDKNLNRKQIKPDIKELLTTALQIALKRHHLLVDCEHILLAILSNKKYSAYHLLVKIGIDPESLKKQVEKLFNELSYLDEVILDASGEALGLKVTSKDSKSKKPKTPALDYFAHDLVKMAKQNKLDPLIGRESELNQIVQVLLRRNKNNPILVGEPGVGKTALVEGLAQLIAKNKLGPDFTNIRIYVLDLALMVAGTTYRGQFEDRVKKIIEELESIPGAIIFIDEIHTLIGAGSAEGSLDMANILKPVLTRKSFRLIGATTQSEFRKYIEKDSALERRFQKVTIKEPDIEETKLILKELKSQYEYFYKLQIDNDVIEFVIDAAARYLSDKFFPDKAIDIIDQSAASVKMKLPRPKKDQKAIIDQELEKTIEKKKDMIENNKFNLAQKYQIKEMELKEDLKKFINSPKKEVKFFGKVTINDCAETISRWTGIPLEHILSLSSKKIAVIDKNLKSKIIGQEEAINLISHAIWRSRAGVTNPNRPIGSFLFLGPTGVGKTELAKNLAFELYGSKESIIKIDMSEFMERHTTSSLVGAPPGYVGYEDAGRLTEAVRNKPYSIVLFDEIEKAHPDIFNILLQILEDGQLTDSKGIKVNFKNTIIILTSNLGMKELTTEAAIGFNDYQSAKNFISHVQYQNIQNGVMKKVKEHFSPEFLNRLDQIIIFKPLGKEEIKQIILLELENLFQRLRNQNIELEVSDPALELLIEKGFDPEMGARPVRRAITDYLETAIATELMNHPKQNKLRALLKKDKLVVTK